MANSANDEFTIKLQKNIFPPNWKNPKPAERYDLLIVGAGPGGMTAATVARDLNAKVAIVEKEHFGGECLSYGCIPSKALIRSSRLAAEIRRSEDFGIHLPRGWKADFSAVIKRVHRLQALLSAEDAAERFQKLGIDVFLGNGHFIAPNALKVGDQTLHFERAIVIAGTHPMPLNVSGLGDSDYLTNQDIFKLTALPPRLGVIGGGPIGCELAQAFSRLGSQVVLFSRAPSLLPREDTIARERLQKTFEKEGIELFMGTALKRAEKKGGEKFLYLDSSAHVVVDEILVAIGRKPAVDGLNLEKAGVQFDQLKGILTNDFLQTSNPAIYAAGDVTSRYKFTHVSKELSTMAVINALKGNREKSSSLIIPWCTYTDPEIAHIGLNEQETKERGISIETTVIEMAEIGRAILDGETEGFLKLLVKEDSDQVIGATLMAAHAGEMLSELGVAMNSGNGLLALAKTIHPFPTQAQIFRTAAQAILKKRGLLLKKASR